VDYDIQPHPQETGSLIYLFRNNVALPSTQDCLSTAYSAVWAKGRDVKDDNSVGMICNSSDNGSLRRVCIPETQWCVDDLGGEKIIGVRSTEFTLVDYPTMDERGLPPKK